jgi:PAS domain S-box-containing protein
VNEGYQRTQEEIARRLRERDAEQAVARITSADKAAGLPVFGEKAMREFERSSSPMRIFELATLKFLAVNDATVSFYGYSREEFLGMSVADLRHPDERAALESSLAEESDCLRHRAPRRHVTKSGQVMIVEVVTQDVLYDGCRARLSLTIDITGRLRMQELLWQRQEEFERLAENLPDLVARFDRSHRFVYLNSAVEKLLGKARHEMIAKTQRELGMPEDLVASFGRSLDEAADTGKPHTLEFSVTAGGGERLFEAYHIPERNAAGQITTVLCVAHDITQRKKDEEEVRRQKNLLAAIIDNLPVGVFIKDADTLRYLARNRFLEELNGYPVETSIGKSAHDLFPKEQADRSVRTDRQALESGKLVDIPEQEMLGKSGERRIFHVRKVPLLGDQGRAQLLVGIADDITDRKRADQRLRETNEFLRSVIESSHDCIKVLDLEGRLLSISRGGQRLMEIADDAAVLGKPYPSFFSGNDRESAETMIRKARNGKMGRFEAYCPTTKGEPKWWDEIVTPMLDKHGRPQQLLVVSRDITEHRRAEAALREGEERFRQLAENIHQVFWIKTPSGDRIDYISPAYEEIWGRRRESLYRNPSSWMDSVHPDDLADVQAVQDAMKIGERTDVEYRIIRPDGTLRWIKDRSYPMRRSDGTRLVCGLAEDISAQKLAEQTLRDSRERLAWVMDATGVGSWLNPLPLAKLNWDRRTRELFFLSPGRAPTIEWFWERLHPDDREPTRLAVEAAIRDRTLYSIDHRVVDPRTGAIRWLRSAGKAVYSKEGTAIRFDGINYDITLEKQAEAERMESALRQRDALVREVHHRIKNSLQGVVWLLRQKIRKYPAVAPDIEEAIGQLQSLALVYGLQETRPDGRLSLADIADAICSSAEKLIGGRVSRTLVRKSRAQACIEGAEAVSVAVALNELVFNALKHQPAQAGGKRVTLKLSEARGTAEVRITNRGRLPRGFDFEGGCAVGYGLGLVRTLLAPPGGTISFNGGRGRVEVKLTLAPPLLAEEGKAK